MFVLFADLYHYVKKVKSNYIEITYMKNIALLGRSYHPTLASCDRTMHIPLTGY